MGTSKLGRCLRGCYKVLLKGPSLIRSFFSSAALSSDFPYPHLVSFHFFTEIAAVLAIQTSSFAILQLSIFFPSFHLSKKETEKPPTCFYPQNKKRPITMHFSFTTISLALLALSTASPLPKTNSKSDSNSDTAAAATTAETGSVLSSSAYNDFQISSGVAGNAEEEANALFSAIDTSNLAAVSKADLDIIKATHDVAEDAEVEAFNPALEDATGDEATALQVRLTLRRWRK